MGFRIFQAYYEKVLLPITASSKIEWIESVQIFFFFSSLWLCWSAQLFTWPFPSLLLGRRRGLVLEHIRHPSLLD